MGINVTLTAKHSSSTEEVVREFTDLDKSEVVDLELGLLATLAEMGKQAKNIALKLPTSSPTDEANRGTMTINFLATKDGAPWAKADFTYPNVPASGFAFSRGLLDGDLARLPKEVKGKRKDKKDKGR